MARRGATCGVAAAGVGGSADFRGGLPDGGVDVARLHVEFLGDVLFGLQRGLVHRLLDLAVPDHYQRGRAVVDDLAELLDIGAGHAPPQVPADPTGHRAHGGGADDRGREQDTEHRADRCAAPGAVPGGHLVLVDVDLAVVVLGHHRGVIGPHRPGRVQVLDDLIVVVGGRLVEVGPDVDEHRFGLRHDWFLLMQVAPLGPTPPTLPAPPSGGITKTGLDRRTRPRPGRTAGTTTPGRLRTWVRYRSVANRR